MRGAPLMRLVATSLRSRGRAALTSDAGVATLIGLAVFLLLALTASQGFVRDEGYYFKAARQYHGWLEGLWRGLLAGEPWTSFSDAALTRAFGYNSEHPGLVKIVMGLSWKLWHGWLGGASGTGFRLGAIALNAVGASFTYLLAAERFSRKTGLLAVTLLLACPHVFYHLHLAAFDGPITALTVVATYAFWRSLSSPRWVLLAGLAFGLALATKHNALFLPPTFALAVLAARADELGLKGGLRLPAIPLALFAMLVLGPLVLYVLYPYGWHDPLPRLGAYYGYHLRHEHYPVEYFGTLYRAPPFPWSFPFGFSALTVPLPVLAAGLAGMVALALDLRASVRRELDALILLSVLVPPLVIAMPSVPIFGGSKHWLPMMPFFCVAAAAATLRAAEVLRARAGPVAALALVGLVVLLPVAETARSQPIGHTWFNELALGHQGAAALGMARGFWGGAGRALLETLNREAPPGASVFSHRMNYDSFVAYQTDGLIRRDLRFAGELDGAAFALAYQQREHADVEYRIWLLSGDARPLDVLAVDGVPIVSLYRLR